MKKYILIPLLLTLVASSVVLSVPVLAKPNGNNGNNNPNKLWGAPTYVLNILGKKSDFSGTPAYDSERRTMFVPEDVSTFNPTYSNEPYDPKIWVERGSEFAVLDPNMFDDGECKLQLGPGKYRVYFVALGKPGMTAELEGWIYNVTAHEYLLYLGEVQVTHSKKPNWESGWDMMTVSEAEAAGILAALGISWADLLVALGYPPGATEIWVFDFIEWLKTVTGYDYAYLWKLVSGCKHIQVRFYEI
jgi:hypothetical protein